jgi:hypothetical protein
MGDHERSKSLTVLYVVVRTGSVCICVCLWLLVHDLNILFLEMAWLFEFSQFVLC